MRRPSRTKLRQAAPSAHCASDFPGRRRLVVSIALHQPRRLIVAEKRRQAFAITRRLSRRLSHRKRHLDAAEEVAIHPVGARQIHVLARRRRRNRRCDDARGSARRSSARGCSPTALGRPAATRTRRARSSRSSRPPATLRTAPRSPCGSSSAFIFAMMRACLPGARMLGFCANRLDDARVQRERRLPDAACSCSLAAEAGQLLEHLGARRRRSPVRRSAGRSRCTGARCADGSCRCRDARSACSIILPPPSRAARSASSWRGVLWPTTPYTTCAPTSSSCAAQLMFASSSKRAISSTTTVTSLPLRAASHQDLHQRGVGAGAIHRLLDGDDVRIVRRLRMKFDHRQERLERMVQQHVAACSMHLEHVAALASAGGHRRAVNGTNLRSGRSTSSGTSHSRTRFTGPFDAIEVVARAGRICVQQEVDHARRAVVRDFEPHRVAEMARAAVRPAARCAGS